MKNNDFKEILKKSFGKEKDDRYHAIAMLAIYGVFLLIIILVIRLGGSTSNNQSNDGNNNVIPTQTPTTTPESSQDNSNEVDSGISGNDINYSYSYTITYNGVSEVYLGKKLDDKEKFTLIKDGITTDYAILSDSYLVLENGVYHITENPSNLFKYCDVEKLLSLVENEISTENENTIKYNVSNSIIASSYKDNITVDNELTNLITFTILNNTLKSVDLDFSNYISSIEGSSSTLIIHMEFVDVGTTEDFEIKVS